MAVLQCKKCGGNVIIVENEKIGECEYCGVRQTIPDPKDEKRVSLFNRANRLRRNAEFDKAGEIYEQLIADFPEEAEAYWCLCLCNYGIEYVEDPASGEKIPTCHRASFEQLRKDSNYEMALENADMAARFLYQDEAKEIDRIRGEILSISKNEEPYDIFICYKETDNNGGRTPDSVLAQDIYEGLTNKGYKVFFSRITLEDKLGQQYEPYIFAALNSAKIMLAVGTDYDYFNAVWVKNEWSRFLKLMAKDKTKMLIPCYKDMDPYDMPGEFKGLQSQDCSKLGFMQDLVRGIDKLFGKSEQSKVIEKVVVQQSGNSATTDSLLKRVFMFLEDGDWKSANEYCEKVLDINPECAEAYLGKLMADLNVKSCKILNKQAQPFDNNPNFQKAMRYGSDELVSELKQDINDINERIRRQEEERRRQEEEYKRQIQLEGDELFEQLLAYSSGKKIKTVEEKIQELKTKHNSEIKSLNEEIEKLEHEKVNFPKHGKQKKEIEEEIKALENQKEELQKKVKNYENEMSTLGLFARSKKKELKEKIDEVSARVSEIESKTNEKTVKGKAISERIEQYGTEENIQKRIDYCRGQIKSKNESFETELKKVEKSQGKKPISLEEIVRKVNTEKDVKNYIKEKKPTLRLRDDVAEKMGIDIKKFYFGSYTQGTDGKKTPIEWRVLAKNGEKALLITEKGIDCKRYNEGGRDTTWEKCTLRKWLNNEFITAAFSEEERKKIMTANVKAEKNPSCNTNPGNDTQDKLFCLSIQEAKKYFKSDEERECAVTEYAKGKGAYEVADFCWWWVRSPGNSQHSAACVYNDGGVYEYGIFVLDGSYAVRPALWINLES